MFRILTLILALLMGAGAVAQPLRIEITDGVIEPMPFAAPDLSRRTVVRWNFLVISFRFLAWI